MVECRKNRVGGHATHGAKTAIEHRVAEIAQEVHLLFFVCALGDAVDAVQQALTALRNQGMPLSIESNFQGAASAFSASLSNTLWLILAAVVTMYIVLGMLYESYIHPVTILSTLPSAAVGALLALLVSLA